MHVQYSSLAHNREFIENNIVLPYMFYKIWYGITHIIDNALILNFIFLYQNNIYEEIETINEIKRLPRLIKFAECFLFLITYVSVYH